MLRKIDDLFIPVTVLILLTAAIVLVVVSQERWVVSMVLVWSALVLAILGKDQK